MLHLIQSATLALNNRHPDRGLQFIASPTVNLINNRGIND
jgi:hypothetical protein